MVKLLTANTTFELFNVLTQQLEGKTNGLDSRNLIFCEEKISLMVERTICERFDGSFNTDVYSFGNYLRSKKRFDNLLSREGSIMVLKRILSSLTLTRFNGSRLNLAESFFDLIIQLKSAKITDFRP